MPLPLVLIRSKEAHSTLGSFSDLESGSLLRSSEGDADLDLLGEVGVDGVDFGAFGGTGVLDLLLGGREKRVKRGLVSLREMEEPGTKRGKEVEEEGTNHLVGLPSSSVRLPPREVDRLPYDGLSLRVVVLENELNGRRNKVDSSPQKESEGEASQRGGTRSALSRLDAFLLHSLLTHPVTEKMSCNMIQEPSSRAEYQT